MKSHICGSREAKRQGHVDGCDQLACDWQFWERPKAGRKAHLGASAVGAAEIAWPPFGRSTGRLTGLQRKQLPESRILQALPPVPCGGRLGWDPAWQLHRGKLSKLPEAPGRVLETAPSRWQTRMWDKGAGLTQVGPICFRRIPGSEDSSDLE